MFTLGDRLGEMGDIHFGERILFHKSITRGGLLMEEEYKILPVEEAETVIFDSAIDLGMDISETCIDMLLDESLVKDIPVLGTFYKAGKIGYSIGRITYIKKLLVFAQEMQRNDVDGVTLKKHKELLQANPKKYYKELEFIIQYLNRQVGYEKSILNARAYFLYLNEEIDYDDLILLWETIDQFFVSDKQVLIEIYNKRAIGEKSPYNPVAYKRLANCGLIDFFNGMAVQDPAGKKSIIARIGNLGVFFCEKILVTHAGHNFKVDSKR